MSERWEAGRDLDNAVSRALGLDAIWATCWECRTVHHAAVERCSDCGGDVHYHEPPYSTSIEAAWLVVERMADLGYTTRTTTLSEYNAAHMQPSDRPSGGHYERAETMPLALCRSALAALAASAGGGEEGA
jgi:hypothetical protein